MWTLIASAMFLSIGYAIGWYLNKPEKEPFQFTWTCLHSDCSLQFKSTDPGALMTVSEFHRESHGYESF